VHCAVDGFDVVAFLAQDRAVALRGFELGMAFVIRLWACPVFLIDRGAWKRNQAPRGVVDTLVMKNLEDQIAAAAGNDAAPILRILPEFRAPIGIDFAADHADEGLGHLSAKIAGGTMKR